MSGTFWFGIGALAFVLVGTVVLICSAHIPVLRELAGAEPLEREPRPEPPADSGPATPPVPRVAERPCDIPHGTTRRQM